MKKKTIKISLDNLWVLETIKKNEKLDSIDITIRLLIQEFKKQNIYKVEKCNSSNKKEMKK